MKFTKLAIGAAVVAGMLAGPALAGSHGGKTTLRIKHTMRWTTQLA